jgi:uncharacterized protein with PIN domain
VQGVCGIGQSTYGKGKEQAIQTHFAQKFVASPSEIRKFAADRMLGRLAKWLRVIGQDVIYGPHLSGYGLIRAARAENRLILTRDRGLPRKQPPDFVFIQSNHYREQLRQVIETCHLNPLLNSFTRCLECNALLQPRTKEAVKDSVPPYVYETQDKFSWCPECRRIYWPATHHQRMVNELMSMGLT